MKNCTAKLKACRTYAEAEKILETNGVSVSGKELLRLGFAVREKQPEIFDNNMATVVREIEDKEHDDETKETNDNTSNESSSTTGTENVADIAPHADTEGMNSSTDTKDQLGAIVNETHPGQMMPPQQGGMNQMPMQQNHMMGQQCPPQNGMGMPPNPQQQMQYTINQQAQMIGKLQEAIQTLNKKITEISRPAPKELDMSNTVGKTAGFAITNPLKETTSPSLNTHNTDNIKSASAVLAAKRRDIKSFNDFLHQSKETNGVQ